MSESKRKIPDANANVDERTVAAFGREWTRFDQEEADQAEQEALFDDYFSIFPWNEVAGPHATGMDVGCGSGRWAARVAPRVGKLWAIDASAEALSVARKRLQVHPNVELAAATVADLPVADESLDFAYSLGVLHHIPDMSAAVRSIVAKLRSGAPLLLYLYYAFDNRPAWYRIMWRCSDGVRSIISRLPFRLRAGLADICAATVYWPLARTGRLLERWGRLPRNWILAFYCDKSFYIMRNDALDRFGTPLEQRLTRKQIRKLLEDGGLDRIEFSPRAPFWCVLARKGSRPTGARP